MAEDTAERRVGGKVGQKNITPEVTIALFSRSVRGIKLQRPIIPQHFPGHPLATKARGCQRTAESLEMVAILSDCASRAGLGPSKVPGMARRHGMVSPSSTMSSPQRRGPVRESEGPADRLWDQHSPESTPGGGSVSRPRQRCHGIEGNWIGVPLRCIPRWRRLEQKWPE
jgi:hypothetical protein